MEAFERDELAYSACMLGVRLVFHVWNVGNEPLSAGKLDEMWRTLEEIATGRLTLMRSPAEMLAPHPNAQPDLRELLYESMNQLVAEQRALAEQVVRGRNESRPKPPE
jgi:hypothetical protein